MGILLVRGIFMCLFVAQCFNRIQPGGFHGGINAEDKSDHQRKTNSQKDRPERNCRRQFQGGGNKYTDKYAENYPDQSAKEADTDGFGEELIQDMAFLGAHGFADTDFPCSFRDRYQHDVHNADPTY